MIDTLQCITLLCTTSFAAIALYVSLGEHPARMECGPEIASFVFGPSYRRAARIQATLALVATAAAAGMWYLQREVLWLAASVLIFLVVPITLIVIRRTNNRLLSPDLDRTSPATYELLRTWARLHGVRTLLSIAATAILAYEIFWG